MSSLERCPLFRMSCIERFHCIWIVVGAILSCVSPTVLTVSGQGAHFGDILRSLVGIFRPWLCQGIPLACGTVYIRSNALVTSHPPTSDWDHVACNCT